MLAFVYLLTPSLCIGELRDVFDAFGRQVIGRLEGLRQAGAHPTARRLAGKLADGIDGPAIDGDFFPNTGSTRYWASTASASESSVAWQVGFSRSVIDNYESRAQSFAVRLVSGVSAAVGTGRFKDNGDDTVTDLASGLMWKKCSEGQSGESCAGSHRRMTWGDAMQQIADANTGDGFAGYHDWRLPNVKELRSLVDEGSFEPAIAIEYFPRTPSENYWSSTPFLGCALCAWYVNFDQGFAFDLKRTERIAVRWVRDIDP